MIGCVCRCWIGWAGRVAMLDRPGSHLLAAPPPMRGGGGISGVGAAVLTKESVRSRSDGRLRDWLPKARAPPRLVAGPCVFCECGSGLAEIQSPRSHHISDIAPPPFCLLRVRSSWIPSSATVPSHSPVLSEPQPPRTALTLLHNPASTCTQSTTQPTGERTGPPWRRCLRSPPPPPAPPERNARRGNGPLAAQPGARRPGPPLLLREQPHDDRAVAAGGDPDPEPGGVAAQPNVRVLCRKWRRHGGWMEGWVGGGTSPPSLID